ncbi:MAG TPA: TonB-dependent receptor [Pseudolabrys sp.]|nr:TonB-dependent receptor [Pseudolabrys sp.]
MPVRFRRSLWLSASPIVLLSTLFATAQAQEELPEIVVQAQRPTPPRPTAPAVQTQQAPSVATINTKLDEARDKLSPRFGASSFDINSAAIEAMPQGINTPINDVLLQAPGVSQDDAVNGDIHVRNEHANVQYRINGITLPDGISGFGHVLDTGFVGSLAVITGALPAQFGLHTSGVVDIQTKSGNALTQGGEVGIYGGSFGTVTPYFNYGGRAGTTEYFFSARGLTDNLGIENPTSSYSAIHDRTYQGNFFSYTSTLIDDSTRVSTIFGNTTNSFQIPNNPNQPFAPGVTSAFGVSNFNSANLNEHQTEQNTFGVVALQKSLNDLDLQIAAFTRYSTLHFVPDTVGDVLFNGQATDVYRASTATGLQGDGAYRLNDQHTLRAGFTATLENTNVSNVSTVLPDTGVDAPFTITDNNSKLGGVAGVYLQDEWRITDKLTLNYGLRFDQMWQYVDANQLSPRVNVVYKPFDGTTLHAGYARYFTPPEQALAGPVNVQAFVPTLTPPATTQQSPVQPERSHYFDAGVVQTVAPGLQVGLDAYYKIAKDLLDDGQFGPGLVLDAFNYAKGENYGVELSATYTNGNFKAYGNFAWAQQVATNIVSNQYLFSADELAYIANHYVFTDHDQTYTGSAGASYLWQGTRYSADLVYGSGLRSGDFNTDHVAPYATVNIGASHEFDVPDLGKVTARLAVVNLFDTTYLLRDGSGIGVFAPQYGQRRGVYVGLSKQL